MQKVSPPVYNTAGLTDEAVAMVFVTARAGADYKAALEESEDIELLLLDHRAGGRTVRFGQTHRRQDLGGSAHVSATG